MSELAFKRVCIVGVGLLGGSVGLALRAAGWRGEIVGVGRNLSTLDLAYARGCIDRAAPDLAGGVRGADLVVLATPVNTIISQLAELATCEPAAGAIVTDVGSTKQAIVEAAEAGFAKSARGLRFVGSHPMAGKTEQGPGHAEAELFRGRPCVVTPTDATDPAARAAVEAMWAAFGMKVVTMTPADHDYHTAVVSHLPHALGVLLIHTLLASGASGESGESGGSGASGGWSVASTGFESATRLASSNPPMRVDIVRDNRDQILAAIDTFIAELDKLCAAIEDDDAGALLAMFEKAKAARDRWLDSR